MGGQTRRPTSTSRRPRSPEHPRPRTTDSGGGRPRRGQGRLSSQRDQTPARGPGSLRFRARTRLAGRHEVGGHGRSRRDHPRPRSRRHPGPHPRRSRWPSMPCSRRADRRPEPALLLGRDRWVREPTGRPPEPGRWPRARLLQARRWAARPDRLPRAPPGGTARPGFEPQPLKPIRPAEQP